MSRSVSIELDERLAEFAEQQVRSDHFDSIADVLRAGLELLEQNASKVEALRAALKEGEDSGPPAEFDFDEFIRRN